MLQLGIIGDIDKIEDEIVRFYSFIGYCVSTAAGIEHMLFNCYFSASDINREEAAKKFYGRPHYAEKRIKLANGAVEGLFSNSDSVGGWKEIISEIDNLSGAKGARNVLGHNPLSWDVYANDEDVDAPFLFELAVSRNSNEAAATNRLERKENLKSVREEACSIHGTYMRLFHFYDTYLKARYKAE